LSADPVFLRRSGTGVTVELRAQPRARRSTLACSQQGTLKAAVTAPAEDGKANKAVIELLAAEWRLPKSAFEVMRGVTARQDGEHFGRARVARPADRAMDAGAGEG
jgi:uncharacterized protein YggU (UPF0235/DUF167 family)